MKNKLLKLLHKFYRKDDFVSSLLDGTQSILNSVLVTIQWFIFLFHFNKLDEKGCQWWEKLLQITPLSSQTIADRQSRIRAKWITSAHNDIKLIQMVCDSWKNGETVADFVSKKIQIQFVGEYGIPADLDSLKKSIEEIKPAHLPYVLNYKYLLKKDIHNVLTKAEMQTYKKHQYCNVKIGE